MKWDHLIKVLIIDETEGFEYVREVMVYSKNYVGSIRNGPATQLQGMKSYHMCRYRINRQWQRIN